MESLSSLDDREIPEGTMKTGYFQGMRVASSRQTLDGRRVCAGRSLLGRKRYFYVTSEQAPAYEQRLVHSQIISLVFMVAVTVVASRWLFVDLRWTIGFLIVVALPSVLQSWVTSGLDPAPIDESSLKPINRARMNIDIARATGAPTLWFLLVAAAIMAAGQLYVLVTDGAWWAWLGLGMFVLVGSSMGQQLLRLRGAARSERQS
jgi:hypothetical protein